MQQFPTGAAGGCEKRVDRRWLLKGALGVSLLSLAVASPASGHAAAKPLPILKPKRLAVGDTVGLVAPGSNVTEDEDIRFAVDLIESLGFRVREGDNLYRRHYYLAGRAGERAADLNKMFKDPSIDAVFCIRGGNGSAQTLPDLDYAAIRSNPKILLGYSDITSLLNGIHHKTGLVTFHGPVFRDNFTRYTLGEFQKILMELRAGAVVGAPPVFDSGRGRVERSNRLTTINPGRAEGRLIGGNLSLLGSLVGTPYFPDMEGAILFIEDVSEPVYRIDRMLTHLRLAGVFSKISALAIGKFTSIKPFDENSPGLEELFRSYFSGGHIPVLRGLMIGHVDDQTVIPVGIRSRLDADAKTLTLLESPVT
ncbi:MAG: LD-carboxypeptidase [Hyphomonadaceae bacterium]|nr:LD-carboxypeptidase [Hyphomonadaceae bacterium]MBC6412498.1 LD-carboxypeptidase [Hyphomonadaceae bacterium]